MSSAPSRTRSLRKPTAGIGENDRPATVTSSSEMSLRDPVLKARQRGEDEPPARSPSRLPQPQSAGSGIARPPRPGSSSDKYPVSTMRPPPRPAGTSRPPITSDNQTPSLRNAARAATEPNTARTITTSRPPLTSDNKTPFLRNGARTPTESNTSLQRRPSASSSSRTGISRPPMTSDNKTPALRSGARTPTEPNTSLQRRLSAASRGHTRTASANPTLSTLSSSIRPTSRSTHARTASNTTEPTISRHGRAASTISASTASTILRPPSQQSLSQAQPRSPTQAVFANPALCKPAFTTLQQHFSPLKSLGPKPATASYLAPPSPSKLPSNQLISAETARLQAELLQLHLLHRSASYSLREYRQSGKKKLEARFEGLREEHEALVQKEREAQGRRNAKALKHWDGSGSGWGLDDKLQMLDGVLAALWQISEPGGRYARVARKFERWVGGVEEILEGRRRDGGVGGEVEFVGGVELGWRDECEGLSRKLEPLGSQLGDLGEVEGDGSSLSVMVKGVNSLLRGMRQELAVMRAIEAEVVRQEEAWIREVIDKGSGGGDVNSEDGETPGAVWRNY